MPGLWGRNGLTSGMDGWVRCEASSCLGKLAALS